MPKVEAAVNLTVRRLILNTQLTHLGTRYEIARKQVQSLSNEVSNPAENRKTRSVVDGPTATGIFRLWHFSSICCAATARLQLRPNPPSS